MKVPVLALVLFGAPVTAAVLAAQAQPKVAFRRDVQPIFREHLLRVPRPGAADERSAARSTCRRDARRLAVRHRTRQRRRQPPVPPSDRHPGDPAFKRGVEFLLRTQLEDGSWLVRSRSVPIQAYFESGFPHGRRPVDLGGGDRVGGHGDCLGKIAEAGQIAEAVGQPRMELFQTLGRVRRGLFRGPRARDHVGHGLIVYLNTR